MMAGLIDRFNRKIDYLRLSITDRCNLRCIYCMPPEGVEWRDRDQILDYEEIVLFARAALKAGISKIRLTGGEPLVRKDVVKLVKTLKDITMLKDLSLTTNGVMLEQFSAELREAGLTRINISIDSLDSDTYRKITRGGNLDAALRGFRSALEAGFDPIKLNVVLMKGVNDDIEEFIRLTYDYPVHVRFIEHMTFDKDHDPNLALSCTQIESAVSKLGEVEETVPPEGAGPARYVKMKGALGTLGFICPTSGHLCSNCNRLRLTPDGRLRTCLFSDEELDVREALRAGANEEALVKIIHEALDKKPEKKKINSKDVSRMMSQIGG